MVQDVFPMAHTLTIVEPICYIVWNVSKTLMYLCHYYYMHMCIITCTCTSFILVAFETCTPVHVCDSMSVIMFNKAKIKQVYTCTCKNK